MGILDIFKRKPAPTPALRADGWANALTGLGMHGMDKRMAGFVRWHVKSQEEADELWRADDIAAKAVEKIPDEMLREGYEVVIPGDKDTSEAIEEEHKRLDVVERAREGFRWARAYGGAGLLIGADDGSKTLEEPLNEDKIKSFDFLTAWSPRELQPVSWFSNLLHPEYGFVEMYRLVPLYQPPGSPATNVLVHASRIIRIAGAETSRKARLTNAQPGWDDSIFVRIDEIIRDFQQGFQGAGIIIQDFATATLKLKELASLLAAKGPNEQSLAGRAQAIELARSIARVTIIDSEEEYKRETTTVAGLADLLEMFMFRVASAADMPKSLLFGDDPKGLNATGSSTLRFFYDQVAALQKRKALPVLNRVTELSMKAKTGPTKGKVPDKWSIKFKPLWQDTQKEQAEARNIQATADVAYVNAGIVPPEAIAKSRFGGDVYSFETQIDTEAIAKIEEASDAEHEASVAGHEAATENLQNPNAARDPNQMAKETPAGANGTAGKAVPSDASKQENVGTEKNEPDGKGEPNEKKEQFSVNVSVKK